MVKLTKRIKDKIEKHLKTLRIDNPNWIDLWDSSLSVEENLKNIIGTEKPININKEEIDYYNSLAEKQEREYIAKLIEKDLQTIKNCKSIELDNYFWQLKEMLNVFLNQNEIHTLFLIGDPGMGKTFNTLRFLSEKNISFEYITGFISPLQLYHLLYKNKDKLIVFDDTQALINNKASLGLLLSAMWSATKHRILQWKTTSKELQAPQMFEFKGKIIFCLNSVPSNTDIKTLLSRCFVVELNFDYYTILKIMYEIAKLPDKDLTIEERIKIVDFIRENSSPATQDFNLRLQKKIEVIYKYNKENWQKLAKLMLKEDKDLALVKQLLEKNVKVKDAVKEFVELTGKSRATFFIYKKRLECV
ncbi:MAG: hypothetical protein ABIK75_07015 [candidate division WOR-3 bacterium]